MSNRKQANSDHVNLNRLNLDSTIAWIPSAGIRRLFLTLLLCAAMSAVSLAQGRYTVSRPIPVPVTPAPAEEKQEYIPQHALPVLWETDYKYARLRAESSTQKLLIYLYADGGQEMPESLADTPLIPACQTFEREILDDVFVREGLDGYVLLKLPMDTQIADEDGAEQPILSLPEFEHMIEHPGLVVIDYAHRDAPYYGEVVGILPFLRGECPTAKNTATFLNLPPGTVTQRTLMYAVRIHPDKPLSTDGMPAPIVMQLASEHALFQAERGVLGHHNFGARSSQAKEVLGDGMPAEICAQSRSGVGLFEGAIACMRAWRYSPAHWSIARRSHTYYGYDMVLGRNGAWYAVGFFIN